MRILQIHNRYRERGGEDTVVETEAALLSAAGHEVIPYRVDNPAGRARAAANLALAPWNPGSVHRLRAAVAASPDVAHVHNTWFTLSPAILRGLRKAGIPVVVTLHNYRLLCADALLFREGEPCEKCVGSHPWHGVRHRCYRDSATASAAAAATIALHRSIKTFEHVDLFLALTDFARALFVRGGLPAERIVVKANSVADPGPRRGAPSASGTVLYVGRLSEEKGVADLVDAWKEGPPADLELVLVGDGPLSGRLAAAAPGVRLVGRLPLAEVQRLMLGARALAFPSRWYEGQPMVLLEALAAGLPVVAANLGGTASTLPRPAPGWLVEPAVAGAWQEGLARLLDDKAVDLAGRRARSAYEASFTPERSRRGLEAAYRRAMGGEWRNGEGSAAASLPSPGR